MSSSTIIVTETVTSYSLLLTATHPIIADMRRILDTFERDPSYQDPLSSRICLLCRQALTTFVDKEVNEVSVNATQIATRLCNMLTNPIDNSLFQSPVRERSWSWEEWIYDEFKEVFHGVSPLDAAPMEAKESHLLIIEVLQFVKKYFPHTLREVKRAAPPALRNVRRELLEQAHLDEGRASIQETFQEKYRELANNAVRRRGNAEFAEKMMKHKLAIEERKQRRLMIQEPNHFEQFAEEIEARIARLEEDAKRRIEDLHEQMASLRVHHQEELEKAKQEAEEIRKLSEEGALNQKIEEMKEQHRAEETELSSRLDQIECETNSLKEELWQKSQAYQRSTLSTIEMQRTVTNSLNHQLEENSKTLSSNAKRLAEQEKLLKRQQERILSLEVQVQQAQAHANHLASGARSSGGSCNIL